MACPKGIENSFWLEWDCVLLTASVRDPVGPKFDHTTVFEPDFIPLLGAAREQDSLAKLNTTSPHCTSPISRVTTFGHDATIPTAILVRISCPQSVILTPAITMICTPNTEMHHNQPWLRLAPWRGPRSKREARNFENSVAQFWQFGRRACKRWAPIICK